MAAAKFKSSIELNVLIGQEGLSSLVTQVVNLRPCFSRKLATCATSQPANYTSAATASAVDTRFLGRSSGKLACRRFAKHPGDSYLTFIIEHLSFADLRLRHAFAG